MTNIHKILLLLTSALCVGLGAACSKDSYGAPDDTSLGRPTMGITIGFDGTRSGDAGKYEVGVGFENKLDIDNNDYRIYFFSTENKYIDSFKLIYKPKLDENETANGRYYYSFFGEAPAGLPLQFKIVFLANWGEYPVEATAGTAANGSYTLVKGTTTIQDICGHAEAQFACPTEDWLSGSNPLIPFYGVREYNLADYVDESDISDKKIVDGKIVDGKIKGDLYIDLSKKGTDDTPIPLLRAMAKVEVIASNDEVIEYVKLTRYNDKGYCAPLNVNLVGEYLKDDYITTPSIPPAATELEAPFIEFTQKDGKFTAYIPEYLNKGRVDSKKARMIVKFKDDDHDYYLDFCDYSQSNKPSYDVLRNYWYKYSVCRVKKNIEVVVEVTPYTEKWLEPDFGINRDENGNIIIYDKDGNVNTISFDGEGNQIFRDEAGQIFLIRNKNKENIIAKTDDGKIIIKSGEDEIKLLEDKNAEIIIKDMYNLFKDKIGNSIYIDEKGKPITPSNDNIYIVVKDSSGNIYELDNKGNRL